jgi:hypothetical protein
MDVERRRHSKCSTSASARSQRKLPAQGLVAGSSTTLAAKVKRDKWTHYSFFEVHDNISRDEILELEKIFLWIFRHDPCIKLANVQLDSKTLKRLSGE